MLYWFMPCILMKPYIKVFFLSLKDGQIYPCYPTSCPCVSRPSLRIRPILHICITSSWYYVSATFRTPFSVVIFFFFFCHNMNLHSFTSYLFTLHQNIEGLFKQGDLVSKWKLTLSVGLLPSLRRRHVIQSSVLPKGPLGTCSSLFCFLIGEQPLRVQKNARLCSFLSNQYLACGNSVVKVVRKRTEDWE